jgi:hypothetical protein
MSGFCDDWERIHAAERALTRILTNIEQARLVLDQQHRAMRQLLACSPELKMDWEEFVDNGGISAAQWQAFLADESERPRLTRRRQHLRLVRTKPKPRPKPAPSPSLPGPRVRLRRD